MMIELLSPSHTERLSDYPERAGFAGALITHRHRRTSIKQQSIYAAISRATSTTMITLYIAGFLLFFFSLAR
jgi:hypothetical protein